MARHTAYTEDEVRDAVANAPSIAAALRRLGLRAAGGNYQTLKKLIGFYGISTDHFDPYWALNGPQMHKRVPLEEILVEGSAYNRAKLKERLYQEGLKVRACELCGQGEKWRGRRMSLIIDHINGVGDDNRLENLRIVCPNCAATLETHCGRKNTVNRRPRACLHCGSTFIPKYDANRYCSRACGMRSQGPRDPHPERRKAERPPYEQVLTEIAELGYSGVGRRYGVSDDAVRKWVRWYRARLDDGEVRPEGPDGDGAKSGASEGEHREADERRPVAG
jgi:hypothetical protein